MCIWYIHICTYANIVYNNAEERTLMTKSGVHFKVKNTVNCKK